MHAYAFVRSNNPWYAMGKQNMQSEKVCFWGLYFGGILISSRQTSKSFQLQSKPAFQDFNSLVIVTAPFLDYKQSLTYPASKAFVA